MTTLNSLPVDILIHVFRHWSQAGKTANVEAYPEKWKHDLVFLAICHNSRAAAITAVYRVVFLKIYEQYEIDQGRVWFKGRRSNLVHSTNIQLIRQNAFFDLVQKVNINMGDGETANIRMHCLYHAITGNMIQSGQNVYLHAKNAITQFTAEFLRISDIDLRYELTGDKSLILMHTLCEHYVEQLRKFNYKSIFYFAQPLKLTNVSDMSINLGSYLERKKLYIYPEPLKKLTLYMRSFRVGWYIFCDDPNTTTISFPNLEELHLMGHCHMLGPRGSATKPQYTVNFPRLKKLTVKTISCDEDIVRGILQSPVKEVRLSGTLDEIAKFCSLGIGKLDLLEFEASCAVPAASPTVAENMNQLLRHASGTEIIKATLLMQAKCDLNASNWKGLTHLTCRVFVDLPALFSRIDSMPDLVSLVITIPGSDIDTLKNAVAFFERLHEIRTTPFAPKIKYLNIDTFYTKGTEPIQAASSTIQNIFPYLQRLVLNGIVYE